MTYKVCKVSCEGREWSANIPEDQAIVGNELDISYAGSGMGYNEDKCFV